ncbi:MAG: lipopolysaccharide transport periplasmic protein LptA [Thermodesulfobacteriota bacterium]
MNRRLIVIVCCLLVSGLFLTIPAWSGSKAPINIEADRMVSLEENSSVLFTGNVDASQADVRILSDEMTVIYEKKANGKQEVDRLKCVGNVEVTRGEWLGTSTKMDYLSRERKVVLTGNAKAWQGKNKVTGDTIVYYLDEGRSEVFNDRVLLATDPDDPDSEPQKPTRVKATIIPQ